MIRYKTYGLFKSRMGMYRFFNTHPQWASFCSSGKGSMKPFTDLIKEFHKVFIQEVIDNRYGADLPCNMGRVVIYKYHSAKPSFSFTGGEFSQKSYIHTNQKTEGYVCKIVYANQDRKYRIKDRRLWAFKPCKYFRSKVSEAFSRDYHKYIVSPDRTPRMARAKDFFRKEQVEKDIDKFLLTYDEFAIW